MEKLGRKRDLRSTFMLSLLPAIAEGLPPFRRSSLEQFWSDFDRLSPAHLRLAMWAATVAIACLLPWGLGYFRTFERLDGDARERVVRLAVRLPVFRDLIKIAKMVACLAYFNDPSVEAHFREAK